MVIKWCSTFPKPPKLEPHHQIEFNVIPWTRRFTATAFYHIYDKKGWGCHKANRIETIIYRLGLDGTSRFIGGGLSDRPSIPRKDQSGILQVMAPSLVKDANRWLHWGSLTPLQRCSRCILTLQPTGRFMI